VFFKWGRIFPIFFTTGRLAGRLKVELDPKGGGGGGGAV